MGLSHAGHDHPTTPAGRAACRAAMRKALPRVDPDAVNPGGPVKKGQTDPSPPSERTRKRMEAKRTRRHNETLAAEHDLAGVPAVFASVIRLGWKKGWVSRIGTPYDENARQVIVQTAHGWITLVWSSANPTGINRVWWRPRGTSVQTTIATVNEAIRIACGQA